MIMIAEEARWERGGGGNSRAITDPTRLAFLSSQRMCVKKYECVYVSTWMEGVGDTWICHDD